MKKLTAKIGEYQKDGATKGRYTNLGVVMSSNDGEYILLDPTVSLAGIMQMQNSLAITKGEKLRDRVMVSMWEEDNQQQQAPQQYQQAPQQQQQQQQQYQAPQSNQYQNNQYPNNGQ